MEITFENVRDIIVNTLSCDADQVTLETNLFEDLEAAFGAGIADEDMANIKTVNDIVEYIKSKVQ